MNMDERKKFDKLERQMMSFQRNIENKMSEMRKFQYETKNMFDDLVILLKGDDFGNSDGIIGEIKDHKNRIRKLETVKNRATWILAGATIPSGYGIWEFLKSVLPPMLILILFTGCLGTKKREDIAHRYIRENPPVLAQLSALHYPVKSRPGGVVFDTLRTVIRPDSVICPDSTKVGCPPCESTIIREVHGPDTVVDDALVAELRFKLAGADQNIAVLSHDNDRLSKQTNQRLYGIIGLSLICLGLIYLVIKT